MQSLWPQTLHRLPKMYDDAVKTNLPSIDTSFPKIEKFSNLPDAIDVNPSAFVSIMEGCSKFCSFCVVPHTRGLEVSLLLNLLCEEQHRNCKIYCIPPLWIQKQKD